MAISGESERRKRRRAKAKVESGGGGMGTRELLFACARGAARAILPTSQGLFGLTRTGALGWLYGDCISIQMKYFIETYGCQMNVHDSERMAGLLEASGYERADDDARRRPGRHQHLQRAREGRGQAVHAAGRHQGPAARDRARAAGGGRRLRRAAGRRAAARALAAHRRGRRHAAGQDAADAGGAGGGPPRTRGGRRRPPRARRRLDARTTSRRFRSA